MKMFIMGIPTASARHTAAAPADWRDLSVARTVSKRAGNLEQEARTETGEVSELGGVVGHGTHEPVGGGLPHGVEDTAEDVQPDPASVAVVVEVDLVEGGGGGVTTGVIPGGRFVKKSS